MVSTLLAVAVPELPWPPRLTASVVSVPVAAGASLGSILS
jgi:hypothetical protein